MPFHAVEQAQLYPTQCEANEISPVLPSLDLRKKSVGALKSRITRLVDTGPPKRGQNEGKGIPQR
jgi:hypothetical protein